MLKLLLTRARPSVLCLVTCLSFVIILYRYRGVSPLSAIIDKEDAFNANHQDLGSKQIISNYSTITERFMDRKKQMERTCHHNQTTTSRDVHIIGYEPANLSICIVHKSASTQWMRLVKYLKDKDNNKIKPFMSYSKYDIHSKGHYQRYNLYGRGKSFIAKSFKTFTTRNPYTRIWSVYIDKFVLPGFWKRKGVLIVSNLRHNATDHAMQCGDDVTFPEFIQYVTELGHRKTYDVYESHWLPVSEVCNPCVFKPTWIANQETFLSDYKYILNETNLLGLVSDSLAIDFDEFEIEILIEVVFMRYELIRKCISLENFVKRIWKAMILNGYLNPGTEALLHTNERLLNVSNVIDMVLSEHRRQNISHAMKKKLQTAARRSAYAQIPTKHLLALQKLYETDFEMFGYDASPPV